MLSLSFATLDDLTDLEQLIEKLFKTSYYSSFFSFEINSVRDLILKLMADNTQSIIVVLKSNGKAVGFIAATIIEQLFNRNERIAVELGFYVMTEFRNIQSYRLLLGSFKTWAKLVGASAVQMGKIKNPREVETYYIKKVK